jgi:outer membrane protein assembly factor BamB
MKLKFHRSSKKILALGLLILVLLVVYLSRDNLLNSGPEILWKNTSVKIIGNLYAQDQILYYSTLDSNFVAIEGLTGNIKWKFHLDNQETILKKPIISNGSIYLLSDKDNLYSLDLKTGQPVKKEDISKEDFKQVEHQRIQQADEWNSQNPSKKALLHSGNLQIRWTSPNLIAEDEISGKTLWSIKSGNVYKRPIIYKDNLYYLRNNCIFVCDSSWQSLHAISVNSGTSKWDWNKEVRSDPVESEGVLYFLDNDYLYAVK